MRLAAPSRGSPGVLDGAWWLRSTDLDAEAPPVLAAIGAACSNRAVHLTYDPAVWASSPGRVYVDGHRLTSAWSHADDPHQVTVTLADGTGLILLVVPPDLDAEQAFWVLGRSELGNVLGPRELLELARLADRDDAPQRWAGEGGSASDPDAPGTGLTAGLGFRREPP